MTRSLTLCLLMSLMATPVAFAEDVPAQNAPAQVSPATSDARQIVEQQLAALGRDDAVAAFSYAAPQIQALFPDPNLFMSMVVKSYSAVYRHRSVEFGPAAEQDGAVVEPVIFTDADGQVWTAIYKLEKQPEGGWKIAGCVVVEVGSKGALSQPLSASPYPTGRPLPT